MDELPNQSVPSYTELDVSLAWRPIERIRTSVVGQNLADAQHAEFGTGNQIPRSVYVQVEWTF